MRLANRMPNSKQDAASLAATCRTLCPDRARAIRQPTRSASAGAVPAARAAGNRLARTASEEDRRGGNERDGIDQIAVERPSRSDLPSRFSDSRGKPDAARPGPGIYLASSDPSRDLKNHGGPTMSTS